jgi:hypothetical protein
MAEELAEAGPLLKDLGVGSCGLRIGEALAVGLRCRIGNGSTLRVKEQVNPAGQLRPLKFRKAGEFRDIPLPQYVSEAIDKHAADHGTTSDGYLFQGRKYKLVVRRTYQEGFRGAATGPGCPRSSSPTRSATSPPPPPWPKASPSPTSPAGSATRASRSPTRSTATSSPPTSTAPAWPSTPPTRPAGDSDRGKQSADAYTAGRLGTEIATLRDRSWVRVRAQRSAAMRGMPMRELKAWD